MTSGSLMKRFLLCLGVIAFQVSAGQEGESRGISGIRNYTREFSTYQGGNSTRLVKLRSFVQDKIRRYLVVDIDTLETRVTSEVEMKALSPAPIDVLDHSRYMRLLHASVSSPFLLENDGVTRSDSGKGRFLTIDMCQSRRAFEKDFFEKLIAWQSIRPTPVALCVSGRWMSEHQEEFQWLVGQAISGRLDVTWVNHSWSHPYRPNLPDENNFLLSDGVNLESEILSVETFLLERGVVPSVFFRFPGLVSSKRQIETLADFGLIALGADAWLALGQKPADGSVILVHGNGNEPKGISMALDLMDSIQGADWFLPLTKIDTVSRHRAATGTP